MDTTRGVVLFGDVVESRRDPVGSSAWLRALRGELDAAYGAERLAPFGITQGDEIQGLLADGADPIRAILVASLHPAGRPMRWAIAAGAIDPGPGPATEHSGEAFLRTRDAIERARARRDRLLIVTGDARADALLDGLAPLLAELLDGLTDRQRIVARAILVDGLRQSEVADRLGVRRATISVTHARARIRSIERLAGAIRAIVAEARPGPDDGGGPMTAEGR